MIRRYMRHRISFVEVKKLFTRLELRVRCLHFALAHLRTFSWSTMPSSRSLESLISCSSLITFALDIIPVCRAFSSALTEPISSCLQCTFFSSNSLFSDATSPGLGFMDQGQGSFNSSNRRSNDATSPGLGFMDEGQGPP